jgi:hypothetical protein
MVGVLVLLVKEMQAVLAVEFQVVMLEVVEVVQGQ